MRQRFVDVSASQPERRAARGVYVLGMHRSGTSLAAGVIDALGLDGGPRDGMLSGDAFNHDGYWEQRPIVELHNELLLRLRGFASAPPVARPLEPQLRHEFGARLTDVLGAFREPWFVKDPRQALVLDAWDEAVGHDVFSVIAIRRPNDIIRSLRHRNGYSTELAGGLWEHYTHAMLRSARGRPCYVLHYEDLLSHPGEIVADLARVLSLEVSNGPAIEHTAIDAAVDLVRLPDTASSSSATPPTNALAVQQHRLYKLLGELRGYHAALPVPQLPDVSAAGQRAIERRRRRLLTARYILGRNATLRAALDRRWR